MAKAKRNSKGRFVKSTRRAPSTRRKRRASSKKSKLRRFIGF